MAGKAPLLLASVLFAIGAVGLAVTSAERAEWGPFEPHSQGQREPSNVVIFQVERTLHDAPDLRGLAPAPPVAAVEIERQAVVAAAQPESAAPTAAPNPPLVVHGISADDSVSAAAATPTPPPLRIINVANDDEPAPGEETAAPADTPIPESNATPAEG